MYLFIRIIFTFSNFQNGPKFAYKYMSFNLPCPALPCPALPCIALHCIALHCIALHCIALHCIALHCIALYCIVLYCIVLYYHHIFSDVDNITFHCCPFITQHSRNSVLLIIKLTKKVLHGDIFE